MYTTLCSHACKVDLPSDPKVPVGLDTYYFGKFSGSKPHNFTSSLRKPPSVSQCIHNRGYVSLVTFKSLEVACLVKLSSFLFCHLHSNKLLLSPRRATRKISKTPFKVLDAPELQDDFYLNLLDWSSQNMLSVGLGAAVYLWSACTCQVRRLDVDVQ